MKDTVALIERFFLDPALWEQHWNHPDWRVRYGLAVAIGEKGGKKDVALLEKMLSLEEERPLFSQPQAIFSRCTDDTRLSEYIGPLSVDLGGAIPSDTAEAWKCRGRVYQAVFFAVRSIGYLPESLKEKTLSLIRTCKDYAVVASACVALRCCGDASLADTLKAIEGTDFCSQLELKKTIAVLEAKA